MLNLYIGNLIIIDRAIQTYVQNIQMINNSELKIWMNKDIQLLKIINTLSDIMIDKVNLK